MNEDQKVSAEVTAADSASDVGQAYSPMAEARQIMRDPDSPYWNKHDPAHREVAVHVENLFKQAYGEEPVIAEDGSSLELNEKIEKALAPPASPNEYQFGIELEEGEQLDIEMDQIARKWFADGQVSNTEAKDLVKIWREVDELPSDEQASYQRQDVEAQLQRIWKDNFDRNLSAAKKVAQSMGPQFNEMLTRTGLGNNRQVIMTLHRAAIKRGLI